EERTRYKRRFLSGDQRRHSRSPDVGPVPRGDCVAGETGTGRELPMRLRKWAMAAVAGAATLGGAAGGAWAQAPAGKAPAPATPPPAAAAAPTPAPAGQVKPAAIVNGETITMAELEAVMNRDGPKAVQVPEAQLRQMRLAVLGQ